MKIHVYSLILSALLCATSPLIAMEEGDSTDGTNSSRGSTVQKSDQKTKPKNMDHAGLNNPNQKGYAYSLRKNIANAQRDTLYSWQEGADEQLPMAQNFYIRFKEIVGSHVDAYAIFRRNEKDSYKFMNLNKSNMIHTYALAEDREKPDLVHCFNILTTTGNGSYLIHEEANLNLRTHKEGPPEGLEFIDLNKDRKVFKIYTEIEELSDAERFTAPRVPIAASVVPDFFLVHAKSDSAVRRFTEELNESSKK